MLGRSHLTDIGDFGGTAAGHFSRIEGQRIANSTTDATQKAPELPLFESAYQHAARSAGADRGRPRREATISGTPSLANPAASLFLFVRFPDHFQQHHLGERFQRRVADFSLFDRAAIFHRDQTTKDGIVRRMHFAAPFDLDCVLFHCRLRFVTPISPEAVSEVNKGARGDEVGHGSGRPAAGASLRRGYSLASIDYLLSCTRRFLLRHRRYP